MVNLGLLNLKEKRGLAVREKGAFIYRLFLEDSVLFEKDVFIYVTGGSFENAHKEDT